MKLCLLASTAAMVLPFQVMALTTTIETDAATLAAATLATNSGITIQAGSEALIGGATQQGTYLDFNLTSNTPGEPDLVTSDGVYLTSGLGTFDTTTNTTNSASDATGTGSFQPLVDLASNNGLSTTQNDSNVLSFDFILDDVDANAVTAEFLFATDEFPTQSVTDIMGIFVNGVNFAFFPNGDLVSNQSGDPNDFFNDNSVGSGTYGIEWNGLTDVFTVTGLANGGGAVNTIDIAIADTSDTIFDSALFFNSLQSTTTTGGGGIGDPDPGVVPLPASGLLILGGLAGLGALRRRKKS